MKKPNPLDTLIRSKLNQSDSKYLPENAWDVFVQYRDSRLLQSESSATTESVDEEQLHQVIQDNLHKHTIPYNSQHWELLEQQIETVETRKHYVFLSKFIEIQAVFFIILLLLHQMGNLNNQNKNNFHTGVKSEYVFETNQPLSDISVTNLTTIENVDSNTDNPVSQPENTTYHPTATDYKIMHSSDKPESPAANIIFDSVMILDDPISYDHQPAISIKDIVFTNDDDTHVNIHPIEALEAKQPYLASEFSLITSMPVIHIQPKSVYSIGMYSAVDVNLINTPFDKVYSKASYNKEALNNSVGIILTRKQNAWESGIGLAYSKRKYNPEVIQEIYGVHENRYSQVTFNRIAYDIISVPVHFNYHFIDKPSWRAYLTSLAIANIVANADYGITDIVVSGRPSPNINRSNEDSRLEEKPFIKGFFNGDNIKDDYFISIGFGFGIEKNISEDFSFLLQPSYQRHILSADLGIGPNKDKIHTSSLLFGIKYKLN